MLEIQRNCCHLILQTNTIVDVAVERAVFLASLIAPTNEESLVTVGEVELIEHEGQPPPSHGWCMAMVMFTKA